MNRLFELLEENTSKLGSFSITYNEHAIYDCDTQKAIKEYYLPELDELHEEWKQEHANINWNEPIIQINWYRNTLVGPQHIILGNSIKDLIDKVTQIADKDRHV